ncbi:ATP-dependent DNA helicase PIF1 [Gracilariopsis chorda]|uniref:ATP-dependent DNA helicase n=1 Tax=Gracilariopsis chorda TaxID=448386 RepID=A0A2V3IF91_9FLOR|nr:ATP-dependent DNA helicase PIF1 [Gracilariopsis chorda]|eukprot:PXF40737.1 ATP-dependent DNA helicase PIF1 [Gracilariopsis chorda]
MKRQTTLHSDAFNGQAKRFKRNNGAGSSHSTVRVWTANSIVSGMNLHTDRVQNITRALSKWKSVTAQTPERHSNTYTISSTPFVSTVPSLDRSQEIVIAEAIKGRSLFITGSAGTGKTFTLLKLIRTLRSQGKQVAVTASTGCAAVAIRGSTIHSFLRLGMGNLSLSKARAITDANVSFQRLLQKTDTLVVDEVSMIEGHLFDLMDVVCTTARKCNSSHKPGEYDVNLCNNTRATFGGLQIIVCGDFFQLPPVRSKSSNLCFAFESAAWKETNLQVHVLPRAHRQSCNSFVGMLGEVRRGILSQYTRRVLNASVIGTRNLQPELSRKGDMLQFTKLFPLRAQAQSENMYRLNALPGFTVRYKSQFFSIKGQNSQNEFGSVECLIDLKQGCPVLCTKNIDESKGLVNGTSGFVVGFVRANKWNKNPCRNLLTESQARDLVDSAQGSHGSILSNHITGKMPAILPAVLFDNGTYSIVCTATWDKSDSAGQLVARVPQIPLILGWAVTIHRSQGMSLSLVETDLSHAFDFGQAYVALSRCKSAQGLRIRGYGPGSFRVHPKVVEYYSLHAS